MKNIIIIFLSTVFSCTIFYKCNSQWIISNKEYNHENYSWRINSIACIVTIDTVTLIGTWNGSGILSDNYQIALDINDGLKKELCFDEHNGLPHFWNNPSINSIAYTDSTVIVGASNGMYICDRRSYRIQQVTDGLPSATDITYSTIKFSVQKIVALNNKIIAHIEPSNYIATQSGQWNTLYTSNNMGYTWEKSNLPDVDSTYYIIDFTTINNYIIALYSNSKGNTIPYISKDYCKSWYPFNQGLPKQLLENYQHICTIGDSLHIIDDKKASWVRSIDDLFNHSY